MPETTPSEISIRLKDWVMRHCGWLLLGLALILVVAVRVRLRSMPLERDEGEYAYAGQLILQGVAPYKDVYNMKLPGTYAAYALIMAIFGQTPAGIHIGVLLVNAASIVLVFLLGRKLLDDISGAVAAGAYALLSLSPSVLGLAGHATHFVVLPALAGFLLLAQVVDPKKAQEGDAKRMQPAGRNHAGLLIGSGLLLGVAFLMKQHGLFFGLFGLVLLLGRRLADVLEVRAAARDPYGLRPPLPSNMRRVALNSPRALAPSGSQPLPTPPGSMVPPAVTASAQVQPIAPSGPTRSAFSPRLQPRPSIPVPAPPRPVANWGAIWREAALFTCGLGAPYLSTCLVLWLAGVFPQFIFWTVSYAGRYATGVPLTHAAESLRLMGTAVIGPDVVFWIMGLLGAVVMWWDERLQPRERWFLTGLLLFSLAAASVGFYFRGHYFILILPAISLLAGVAVSRALYSIRQRTGLELLLAAPVLLGLFVAVAASFIGHGSIWFAATPAEAMRQTYGTTLFSEAIEAADWINADAAATAKIAVLGSEPEIYFYSRRRSATGHIYMYPLMDPEPVGRKLQDQMIQDIETKHPEYLVFVDDELSWLKRPNSDPRILNWANTYWANLDLVKTFSIQTDQSPAALEDRLKRRLSSSLLVFRLKAAGLKAHEN